jgi:ubiquinone/menaquinone biosynthesis C-methylase UbiE
VAKPEKSRAETAHTTIAGGYFAAEGTVVSWWDPLGGMDERLRAHLTGQQDDLLARCPVAGKKVLDCCTGRGRMAIAAAQQGAESVTGIDISEEMIAHARSNASGAGVPVDFKLGNITDLDMPGEAADIVFCLEALLHLDDPWRAVAEFYRVLTPGGSAVVTTNGANPLARLAQPPRRGAHPAGRMVLATVTALNEVMTALFGFMWRRTPATGWLYSKIFRVPVRPLYRSQVTRMLKGAGFFVERWDVKSGPFVREYRWIARKPRNTAL